MMSRENKKTLQQASGEGGGAASGRVVLVGTYKGDQLTRWRGWYNYPITDDDFSRKERNGRKDGRAGSPLPADLSRINELWLFQGTSGQKKYKAEFVGVKTREELVRDYGYPARGKAHGERYLLFKTEFKYTFRSQPPEDAESVIVRTADFAKRSPTVAKRLKAYLESPDRHDPDLAKCLPPIITKLSPEQLRVCDVLAQCLFQKWTSVSRSVPLLDKIESIVMSIGEFGRTHALSSSDAYVYLKKYKGLEYLDKYHVSLSCFPIESLVDDLSLVCRNNGGTLRCSRSIMDRIAM